MKRGYYFSLDAMVAATMLAAGLILAATMYVQESSTTSLQQYSQDAIGILSSIKLSELNSSIISSMAALGIITDMNKTVLEQAGEFWAKDNLSQASQLLSITAGIIPEQFKYGVFYDSEQVYGSNETPSTAIVSSRRLISGIAKSQTVSGFSSRAVLSSFQSRRGSAYLYFGGFVGQGNLTFRLVLPDVLANVTSAYLELSASSNFSLFINGNYSGSYAKGTQGGGPMAADKWQINSSYLQSFSPGTNYINITFYTESGNIGGGFLRVSYMTSALNDSVVQFFTGTSSQRYYFPGIDGIINLYDSFFVPGNITQMATHLHYKSDFNVFLTIGNVTVFNFGDPGEQSIDLDNAYMENKLEYVRLSSQTIPIRLGTGSGNSTTISTGFADVVLATDLSGTMEWCSANPCTTAAQNPAPYCGSPPNYKPGLGAFCNRTTENYILPDGGSVCSARWHAICPANDTRRLDIAINASKKFTSILLGTIGNKMGIVGYTGQQDDASGERTDVIPSPPGPNPFPENIVGYLNMTDNASQVTNFINMYMDTYWGTCIACGVEKAVQIVNNISSPERYRSIVVMSDGQATDKRGGGVGHGVSATDAIDAAQEACNLYNISVNTVGFGADADAATLQSMACNGGSYYNASNMNDLIAVYTQIANNLNNVSYKEQVINYSGSGIASGLLYEDSYIEYNYTPAVISEPGSIPAALETPRFGNNISQATLNLLPGYALSEVRVTSYSDDKWTDNLTVSNSIIGRQAFDLGGFSNDYSGIGDPFVVYARPGLFETGDNTVQISTATSQGNYTGGSVDDKIIYTILVPNSVSHAGVFSKADGCNWLVFFEDGTNSTLALPTGYFGTESCTFSPKSYAENDAVDDAIYRLLSLLDFNGNGLLDVILSEGDLGITTQTLSGMPSLWGPAIAEVRVWQ